MRASEELPRTYHETVSRKLSNASIRLLCLAWVPTSAGLTSKGGQSFTPPTSAVPTSSGPAFSGLTSGRQTFSEANLTSGRQTFSEANLGMADLIGGRLDGARLRKADTRGANLRAANLSRANVRKADLRQVNLHRGAAAQISEAILAQAAAQNPEAILAQASAVRAP